MINVYAEAKRYLALQEKADAFCRAHEAADRISAEERKRGEDDWEATCGLGRIPCTLNTLSAPKGTRRALTVLARWYRFEEKLDEEACCVRLKEWYSSVMQFTIRLTPGEKARKAAAEKLERSLRPGGSFMARLGEGQAARENLGSINAWNAICRANAIGPLGDEERRDPRIPLRVLKEWQDKKLNEDTRLLLFLEHYRGFARTRELLTQQDVLLWSGRSDSGELKPDDSIVFLPTGGLLNGQLTLADQSFAWKLEEGEACRSVTEFPPGKKLSDRLKPGVFIPAELDAAEVEKAALAFAGNADKEKNKSRISLDGQTTAGKAGRFCAAMLALLLLPGKPEPERVPDDWAAFFREREGLNELGRKLGDYMRDVAEQYRSERERYEPYLLSAFRFLSEMRRSKDTKGTYRLTPRANALELEIGTGGETSDRDSGKKPDEASGEPGGGT